MVRSASIIGRLHICLCRERGMAGDTEHISPMIRIPPYLMGPLAVLTGPLCAFFIVAYLCGLVGVKE